VRTEETTNVKIVRKPSACKLLQSCEIKRNAKVQTFFHCFINGLSRLTFSFAARAFKGTTLY